MGAAHSSGTENTKLPLAERRYRVSEPRAAAVFQRRSTRKLGSVVAIELKEPSDAATNSKASTSRQCSQQGEGQEVEETPNSPREVDSEDPPLAHGRKASRILRQRRVLESFQLTRTENPANAAIMLTRTQRVLIENSWKRAKKGAAEGRMGDRIFHTILMAQPDIKLLFGLEKVPQGRLKYEGHFRRHAGLLNRALEYIVKNLQYTDKLGQHFQTLGKKHCQMNGGRAFPAHYWDTFLECITQSILECDGASGGRQHRCRESAMAWRSLVSRQGALDLLMQAFSTQISFIVQQMRRGFDEERILRKRFSASLMGLRGVTSSNTALQNGQPAYAELVGRPRPSTVHQYHHHSHGSLGSLEMLPLISSQYPSTSLSMSTPYSARARAASAAISPLAMSQQHSKGSIGPGQSSEDEPFGHLMPQQQNGGSSSNSSSARSASWCAEVMAADQLRRLQINEEPRTARSELNIDGDTGEVFYTPRMTRNEAISPKWRGENYETAPPKQALAAVQLLLNAASSEGQVSDHPNRPAVPGILLSRHSFSEFIVDGEMESAEKNRNNVEFAAAVDASRKLLGLAQASAEGGSSGDSSPSQPRRLSAL